MLEAVDFGGIGNKEQRAELPFRHSVVDGLILAEIEELAELTDFFVESHLFEERIDALMNCGVIGTRAGRSLRKGARNDGQREQKD